MTKNERIQEALDDFHSSIGDSQVDLAVSGLEDEIGENGRVGNIADLNGTYYDYELLVSVVHVMENLREINAGKGIDKA